MSQELVAPLSFDMYNAEEPMLLALVAVPISQALVAELINPTFILSFAFSKSICKGSDCTL